MSMMQEFESFDKKFPKKKMLICDKEFSYRYHKNGDTTIVLLTGGLGFSDLFYMHYEAFAEKYSVITFDYPYGLPTNTQLADAIAELIKRLDIEKAFLVGQSYGGLIAQVIAKLHPEVVDGLILSNTGSLSKQMNSEGRKCMLDMITGLAKTKKILKYIPIAILKPFMLKKIMLNLKDITGEDKIFIAELFEYAIKLLTSIHEIHMCSLMIDLNNYWDMTPVNFAVFKDRTLLILSKDDMTFNDGVKQSLINIMPNPIIRTDISGGHLALFSKIQHYVEAVENFIDERKQLRIAK